MGRGRKPKVEAKPDADNDSEEIIISDEDEIDEKKIKEGKRKDEKTSAFEVPISSKSCRKMLIVHKGIDKIGWNNLEQVAVLHPRTGNKAIFLIDSRNEVEDADAEGKNFFFYEVMTLEQDTRSWFLDESVVRDGNLYVSTPIDPLFIVLSTLMKSSQAKPLRDHLSENISNKKAVNILCSRLVGSEQMENISIKKVCDDIIAFKYSEENVLSWLSQKVDKTAKFLFHKGISSTEASVSANFTKSSNNVPKDGEKIGQEFIRYACEIVGEYIVEDLKKKLYDKYGLVLANGSKRKSEAETPFGVTDGQNKKIKKDGNGSVLVSPLEDYGSSTSSPANPAANLKINSKEKEFQKAAKGSHSLFKFFAPKAK